MATQTEMTSRIDAELRVLLAEVNDLPERARFWDEESEDNQVAFHLEWENLMDVLTTLDRAYHADEMSPHQRRAYGALLRKLKAALPIIERLDLYRPPVPLAC